jgi:putative DNA-invertase from lambdoid prophage Rac
MNYTYLYTRHSTKDQTADRQIEAATALNGQPFHRVYCDDAISGKVPAVNRPQFIALLDKIEAGDTVVIHEVSRLSRGGFIDAVQALEAIKAKGAKYVINDLPQLPNDLAVDLILPILSWVAKVERQMIVKRTREGLEAAKANGKKLGGSTISRTRRDEILALLLTGGSIREVAKTVKCSPNTVMKYRDAFNKENPDNPLETGRKVDV